MNRKTVQFLFDCTAFYNLNPKLGTLYRIITCILFIMIAVIQSIIYSFQNIDNIYKSIFPMSNVLFGVTFIFSLASFLRKSKDVQLLLKHIDQHMYTYSDEPVIQPSYTWVEKENNILRLFLFIWKFNTFLVICVALSPCIQLIIFGRVEIAIYPSWIPWKVNGIVSSVCAYLTNLCPLLAGYFSFNVCLIFPLFVTLEFRRQRKRLCTALLSIEKRTEERIRATENGRKNSILTKLNYHKLIRHNITDCIKHHQMLIE